MRLSEALYQEILKPKRARVWGYKPSVQAEQAVDYTNADQEHCVTDRPTRM